MSTFFVTRPVVSLLLCSSLTRYFHLDKALWIRLFTKLHLFPNFKRFTLILASLDWVILRNEYSFYFNPYLMPWERSNNKPESLSFNVDGISPKKNHLPKTTRFTTCWRFRFPHMESSHVFNFLARARVMLEAGSPKHATKTSPWRQLQLRL